MLHDEAAVAVSAADYPVLCSRALVCQAAGILSNLKVDRGARGDSPPSGILAGGPCVTRIPPSFQCQVRMLDALALPSHHSRVASLGCRRQVIRPAF